MVVAFRFLSPSSASPFLLAVLFLLGVWRKAEVLLHTVVVVDAVGDQDHGPSGEGRHVVPTGDLNCRFQGVAVTVQQGDAWPLLTGWVEM